MQPNQQDQKPTVPVTQPNVQQPYVVPDYLHLDPVTGQQAKKSNKKLYIVISIFILFLIGIGAVAIVLLSAEPPEKLLYKALDDQMRTSYFEQDTVITSKDKNLNVSAKSQTDCSSAANCKSKDSYSYSTVFQSSKLKKEVTADEVVVTNKEYFFYPKAASQGTLPVSAALNKWYKVSSVDSGIFNMLGSATYHGPVLSGNFNDEMRQQLLSFIQSNNIYPIDNVQAETLGGQDTKVYTLNINQQRLTDLNNKARTLLKETKEDPTFVYGEPSSLKLWITSKGKIIKMSYDRRLTDDSTIYTTTESIAYPDAVEITEPRDAILAPSK